MSLYHKTLQSVIWSLVQSWFVKFFSLAVFFILARYLDPEEFGIAAVIALILAFVTILVEMGFPQAIIQKSKLNDIDLNFPFYLSLFIAFVLSSVLFLFAKEIAVFLNAKGAEFYIKIAAIAPILISLQVFQKAVYQRQLNFKGLSIATIIGSICSGVIALILANVGAGALSIVVQLIVLHLFIMLVIWFKPIWKPTLEICFIEFKSLFSYSSYIFIGRLVDFASLRIIDFIVLIKFGLAGLGLFTISSKLYITLIELLSSSLFHVMLSAFSKMQKDIAKLRESYLTVVFLVTCIALPLFIVLTLVSSEIVEILFNDKWQGMELLMQMLFVLGAVQVVQYINGSLIGSVGKAKHLLFLNVLKFCSALLILTLVTIDTIEDLVFYFVLSQLLVTPVSFYITMKSLSAKLTDILSVISPSLIATSVAYVISTWLKANMFNFDPSAFLSAFMIGGSFIIIYILLLTLISGHKLKLVLLNFLSKRKESY